MRLSKVTSALIAAGIGAGLATGYTHLDTPVRRRCAGGHPVSGGDRRCGGPGHGIRIFPISPRWSIAPVHPS